MKKFLTVILIITSMFFIGCGNDNYLNVELVDDYQEPDDEVEPAPLFNNEPGTFVSLDRYASIIDPVGTSITDDFDGDGIDNVDETASNIWVADYPVIEAYIATPVSMKIEIQDSSLTTTKSLSNEITSSDVNDTSDYSTEAVHRNEINLKTVQFQDSFNKSDEESYSKSISVSASFTTGKLTPGGSASYSNSISRAQKHAYGETKTKWKDVPFKNNTNKKGWAQKGNTASANSRKLRGEMKRAFDGTYEIKANAGYVRASLYIDNLSVNMPVKLSNILCSLMLETPDGQLLPVQSFRLRNDDFSIFEINLYGKKTFGPYVIELNHLNTHELKEAISNGYNPKIYIVDYDMEHVKDSNYRTALKANFAGDNLNIIEENAKGRTAAVRFIAPEIREFYRVVAFDTNGSYEGESATSSGGASTFSPGVSLKKALRRIGFSKAKKEGAIVFANYVMDFTGIGKWTNIEAVDGKIYNRPTFLVQGIKSVSGYETKLPILEGVNAPDYDGLETYVMKPLEQWDDEDYNNFKMWTVFSDSKYYFHTGDRYNNDDQREEYTYTDADGTATTVPVTEGVSSQIWPGDHYDITYLDLTEYMGLIQEFGNNPIETVMEENKIIQFNTRWNSKDLGEHPFYPITRAEYLGEAAPGDIVEIKVKLKDTAYLNPTFGAPSSQDDMDVYQNFSYNWQQSSDLFDIEEAVDFELSFGLGGDHSDWVNILYPMERSPYSEYNDKITVLDKSWDFMEQEFTVYLLLDDEFEGVEQDGAVKLYLRPAMNNAYRESMWPLPYNEVKQFRGVLASKMLDETNTLTVMYPAGEPAAGDTLYIEGAASTRSYTIDTATANADKTEYEIKLTTSTPEGEEHLRGEQVYVNLDGASQPGDQQLKLAVNDDFFQDWNSQYGITAASEPNNDNGFIQLMTGTDSTSPTRYLGFALDYIVGNWIGGNNHNNPDWNDWASGEGFMDFMSRLFYDFLETDTGRGLRLLIRGDFSQDEDMAVSATNGGEQINVQVVNAGDRAFAVWQSGNTLRGRVYDLSGDEPVAVGVNNDFPVADNPVLVDELGIRNWQVAVSETEGRAIVVWESATHQIMATVYDITESNSTPEVKVGEFELGVGNVSNISSIYPQNYPRVGLSGNRAFVVWHETRDTYYRVTVGRICDITGSTPGPIGDSYEVYRHSGTIQLIGDDLSVSAEGNKVSVIWLNSPLISSIDPPPPYDLSLTGRLIDISGTNPTAITDVFNIGQTTSYTAGSVWGGSYAAIHQTWDIKNYDLQSVMNNNKLFIVWRDSINPIVRGMVYDIAGDTPEPVSGNSEFSISNGPGYNPQISISGERAFIVWATDTGIMGNIYDLNDPLTQITGLNGIPISTTNNSDQVMPNVSSFGDSAIVSWHSDDSSNFDIRGRIIDISGNNPGAVHDLPDFLASTTNGGNQTGAVSVITGTRAFVLWQSDQTGDSNILGRGFNVYSNSGQSLPHGLNYFMVSPLIERNYDVQVRIVE